MFKFFYRSKKLSSVEVVTAFIERAKEVNELINAVVEDRYSDALEEAKEVDKFLQTLENSDLIKEKKPFLGVPFTTKESNEAKGNFIFFYIFYIIIKYIKLVKKLRNVTRCLNGI